MLINYSLSFNFRMREARLGDPMLADSVYGDHLITPALERRLAAKHLKKTDRAKAETAGFRAAERVENRAVVRGEQIPDHHLGDITERSERMKVSVSGDVIFSPATQKTFRSAALAAKANLERRMPGAKIYVSDVMGDGLINCSISADIYVDNLLVKVEAKAIASARDIAAHTAVVTVGAKVYDIDPVDRARSPEDLWKFLHHLASNCVARG